MDISEATALTHKIGKNADTILALTAKLSGHEPYEAVASLALSGASLASAAGLSKAKYIEAIELAWKQTVWLRK